MNTCVILIESMTKSNLITERETNWMSD